MNVATALRSSIHAKYRRTTNHSACSIRFRLALFTKHRLGERPASWKRHDKGDIYLWTCIDQRTKLMPSFRIGKRSADNDRRFMLDVAGRLVRPKPHASDDHAFGLGHFRPIIQISMGLDKRLLVGISGPRDPSLDAFA